MEGKGEERREVRKEGREGRKGEKEGRREGEGEEGGREGGKKTKTFGGQPVSMRTNTKLNPYPTTILNGPLYDRAFLVGFLAYVI